MEGTGFHRHLSGASDYLKTDDNPKRSVVFLVHVGDFVLTGTRNRREAVLELLKGSFEVKTVVHLKKVGDRADMIGRCLGRMDDVRRAGFPIAEGSGLGEGEGGGHAGISSGEAYVHPRGMISLTRIASRTSG